MNSTVRYDETGRTMFNPLDEAVETDGYTGLYNRGTLPSRQIIMSSITGIEETWLYPRLAPTRTAWRTLHAHPPGVHEPSGTTATGSKRRQDVATELLPRPRHPSPWVEHPTLGATPQLLHKKPPYVINSRSWSSAYHILPTMNPGVHWWTLILAFLTSTLTRR